MLVFQLWMRFRTWQLYVKFSSVIVVGVTSSEGFRVWLLLNINYCSYLNAVVRRQLSSSSDIFLPSANRLSSCSDWSNIVSYDVYKLTPSIRTYPGWAAIRQRYKANAATTAFGFYRATHMQHVCIARYSVARCLLQASIVSKRLNRSSSVSLNRLLSAYPTLRCMGIRVKGKRKGFPILNTEGWARSWSRCTGSQPAGDCKSSTRR